MALNIPPIFGDLATSIVTAIIILLLGFVAGKIIGNILGKVFLTLSSKQNKKKKAFLRNFANFISLCIYIISVILSLNEIGITIFVLDIILTILLLIVLGALLFSLLNFLLNLFFGLRILMSNKFKKGDQIKIKKISGTIEKISISNTKIKTANGEKFIIPNILFFKYKFSVEKNKFQEYKN